MVSDRSNGVNWRIILAIAGLILIGAGEPPKNARGSNQTNATKPKQSSAPTVPLDSSKTVPKVNTEKQQEPCGNNRYTSDDDLCAQWKAADAAADAAKWAWWQLWLSGGALLGLIVSLAYTRRALIAADNTNKAFIRAEAGLLVPSITFFGIGEWADSFKISMHNVGRTPVTVVHHQLHYVQAITMGEIKVPIENNIHQFAIMIDAGKPFILPYNDLSSQPELFQMIGGAIYNDMFGRVSSCQIAYWVNRRTREFGYVLDVNFASWDELIRKQNTKKK